MNRPMRFIALITILFASPIFAQTRPTVGLQELVRGIDHPTYLTSDGTKRLFIVEQPGRIKIFNDGQLQPLSFLDIAERVKYGGECGVLSVAFHPKFATKGLFYINYTDQRPKLRTVISEFHVDPTSMMVNAVDERVILTIDQPYANHNGGQLQFGPDGMLYIGMGDGGARDDPHNNAQNPQSLLGKILRIDVTPRQGYAIPKDNPFVGKRGIAPEIWTFGMRNPWRFTFDRQTKTCYAGDVGQDTYEEVDIITKGGNYGWNIREGLHPFKKRERGTAVEFKGAGPLIDPIAEYDHKTGGISITGGYVYRGRQFPSLVGWYLYGDYSSGRLWGLKYDNGKVTVPPVELFKANVQPTSFGEDADGELYLCSYNGVIYKIVARVSNP